jgi:hypothetical protein
MRTAIDLLTEDYNTALQDYSSCAWHSLNLFDKYKKVDKLAVAAVKLITELSKTEGSGIKLDS